MKTVIVAAFLLLTALSALAEPRVDARSLTCAQLSKLVKQHKALLIKSGWWTGKYVTDKEFCGRNDGAISNAWLRAADGACVPGIFCRWGVPPR